MLWLGEAEPQHIDSPFSPLSSLFHALGTLSKVQVGDFHIVPTLNGLQIGARTHLEVNLQATSGQSSLEGGSWRRPLQQSSELFKSSELYAQAAESGLSLDVARGFQDTVVKRFARRNSHGAEPPCLLKRSPPGLLA